MKTFRTTLAASTMLVALVGTASAQDAAMQGHAASMALPKACQTGKAPPMQGMEEMKSMMSGMNEVQKAYMQGMMETQGPMMEGMMAEDPDIAFACGMIPHHQTAIEMAEVELAHGDDEWAKEMARKIIAAQEKEIAEMTKWIEGQAK